MDQHPVGIASIRRLESDPTGILACISSHHGGVGRKAGRCKTEHILMILSDYRLNQRNQGMIAERLEHPPEDWFSRYGLVLLGPVAAGSEPRTGGDDHGGNGHTPASNSGREGGQEINS